MAVTQQYQGQFYTSLPYYVQYQLHLCLVHLLLGLTQDNLPCTHTFAGDCDSSSLQNSLLSHYQWGCY